MATTDSLPRCALPHSWTFKQKLAWRFILCESLSRPAFSHPRAKKKHTHTQGLMFRVKNDGWQAGKVRLDGVVLERWVEDSLDPFPHLLALPVFPRLRTSSLSSEFSLVNSTRRSSLSALKEEDWWCLIFKKGECPQGRGWRGEKSGFPSLTRLRYMHRRAVSHRAERHRRDSDVGVHDHAWINYYNNRLTSYLYRDTLDKLKRHRWKDYAIESLKKKLAPTKTSKRL